ncbi:MAG: CHAT domain-containing protein [Cyclobacteriaceae bacterium]
MRRFTLHLVCLFISISPLLAQKVEKFSNKSFSKADGYYYSGEYKKAIKTLNKAVKKIKKSKEAVKINFLGISDVKRAKYLESYGEFDRIDTLVETGIANTEGEDNIKYKILAEIEAIKAYYSYGDFIKADIHLERAFLDTNKINDLSTKNELLVLKLKISNDQGYFSYVQENAIGVASRLKDGFNKKYEVLEESTGEKVSKKRSKNEIDNNKLLFGDTWNEYVRSYILSGNYLVADTLLERVERIIRKEGLGGKSINQVNTLKLYSDYYLVTGDERNSRKSLEKAMKMSLKSKGYKLKPYSKQYVGMYEEMYGKLLSFDEINNFRKMKSEIEPLITRNYPRKSFYSDWIKLINTQRTYYKKKYEKGINEVYEIIEDTTGYIPFSHPLKVSYLEKYLDKCTYIEDKKLSDSIVIDYVSEYEKLYGTRTPQFHKAKLYEASHNVLNIGKYAEAEAIYKTSFDSVVVNAWHPMHYEYQTWVNTRSLGYVNTDYYSEADHLLTNYDKEVNKYFGRVSIPKAISLQKIGDLQIDKGSYSLAQTTLDASAKMYDDLNDSRNINYMYTLRSQAKLKMVQGAYDEAEDILDDALKVAKKNDLESEFNIEGFATLYMKQGKYHKVDHLLQSSLKDKKKKYGTYHQSLIDTYRYLGELNVIFGNYTQAEKDLKNAEVISNGIFGKTSLKYAGVKEVQAQLYEAIGDYENEEVSYKEILAIQESVLGNNHVSIAKTYNSLALVEYFNGKSNKEVDGLFNESLTIIENNIGKTNPTYAQGLMDKASFYIATNKLTEADELLNQADRIWETSSKLGKNNVHSAEITTQRAAIAKKQTNYKKSLKLYKDAAKMYRKIFSEDHPDYVYALSKTAQLNYILGDIAEANDILEITTQKYLSFIEKYFPALSEREKAKFWSRIKGDFEFYNTVAFSNKKTKPGMIAQVYNNTLATKAILLSSSIKIRKTILSSGDSVLIATYNDWVNKREYITSIAGTSDEQLKAQGIDFNALENEIEGLEKTLSEKSDVFKKGNVRKLVNWKDIQATLDDNEYAIEMIRYRYFDKDFTDSIVYAGLVISKKTRRAPKVVEFPLGNQFETRYIKYYRNSIKYKVDDKWSYAALWKPIEKMIPEGAKVYFSSEGVYNQLNMEAVRIADNKFVLDRNELVLVSNTKDLLNTRSTASETKNKDKTAVLIGNPAFYDIRATHDTVFITQSDNQYASEYDKIYVEKADKIIATYNDGLMIKTEDKIIATEEDEVLIKTIDKVYAHLQDSIYITEEDGIKRFDKLITLEDKIYAKPSDQVLITTQDSIYAKKNHGKIIRTEEEVWVEARHGKIIGLKDSIYAREEHKILITKSDKVINEEYYSGLTVSQLPGAESEIKSLGKLLKKNKWEIEEYIFDEATEDKIKSFKSPHVFHIATHGFFVGDPKTSTDVDGLHKELTANNPLLRSGLILRHGGDIVDSKDVYDYNSESGILTAYEAMGLNFDNTELAVLSACETGLGEVQVGEGVYGLQRSFFVAGVQNVIMSLFKVSDEATQKLMNGFYKRWSEGMTKRKAFIEAKKELRKEYKDPIYWGAFIMIGA